MCILDTNISIKNIDGINNIIELNNGFKFKNIQKNVIENLKIETYLPNDKIKLSLVGCGGRGTGAVINALNADDNIELISMCDVFEDKIESSLNNLKNEFKGTSKIQVKNENCFTGFNLK